MHRYPNYKHHVTDCTYKDCNSSTHTHVCAHSHMHAHAQTDRQTDPTDRLTHTPDIYVLVQYSITTYIQKPYQLTVSVALQLAVAIYCTQLEPTDIAIWLVLSPSVNKVSLTSLHLVPTQQICITIFNALLLHMPLVPDLSLLCPQQK